MSDKAEENLSPTNTTYPRYLIMGLLTLLVNYIFITSWDELIIDKETLGFLTIDLFFLFFGGCIGILLLKKIKREALYVITAMLEIITWVTFLFPHETNYITPYYTSMGLLWGLYGIHTTSFIEILYKEEKNLLPSLWLFTILGGYALNIILRPWNGQHNFYLQIFFLLITLILVYNLIKRKSPLEGEKTQSTKESIKNAKEKKKSSMIFSVIKISLLFVLLMLPFMHYELLSYESNIGYNTLGFIFAFTFIFITGALLYRNLSEHTKYLTSAQLSTLTILLGIISLITFGSYLYFPPGNAGYSIFYVITIIWIGLSFYKEMKRVVRKKRTSLASLIAGIVFLSTFISFLLKIILLEKHIPFLWYPIIAVPLVIDIIEKIRGNRNKETHENKKHTETREQIRTCFRLTPNQIYALVLIGSLTLPLFASMIYTEKIHENMEGDRPREVWISLYTWYGVPGMPAGKYNLPQFSGGVEEWKIQGISSSNLTVQTITDNKTQYSITSPTNTTFALTTTTDHFMTTSIRTYFEINFACSEIEKTTVIFRVLFNNEIWQTYLLVNGSDYYGYNGYNISLKEGLQENQAHSYYRVFPVHFIEINDSTNDEYANILNNTLLEGKDSLQLIIEKHSSAELNFTIDYIETSRWKHYNEDYHTVRSEEDPRYWKNDPPVFKATAHSVFYNQSEGPWPDIETYGFYNHSKWHEVDPENATQYGLYDSLDPVVIRSQLKLMERAGIDVVELMHPWGVDVIETIFDVALEIHSNLSFFLYAASDLRTFSTIMERFAFSEKYSKLYYRIDGKPVYNYGMTAELNRIPYPIIMERLDFIRRNYNVYLIVDGLSGPYLFREDLLDIFDGWYYYDTSAFYRHGWGDPRIKNYQADGTLPRISPANQLDRIFGMQAKVAHSKGKTYSAVIIPGTDNTVVHGFIGSPFYDGRTGTINTRENGLTYNRTWEAAISAQADYAAIVSWNELHEGTEIEPTIEDGTLYVNLTAYWATQFKQ